MKLAASVFVMLLTLVTAAGAQAPAVRVFITDDLSPASMAVTDDLRPAEWTFGEFANRGECRALRVTNRSRRAHFTLWVQGDSAEIEVDVFGRGGNQVAVFDGWGDMLYAGSTRQFGNALKDACEAIDRQIESGAEMITGLRLPGSARGVKSLTCTNLGSVA